MEIKSKAISLIDVNNIIEHEKNPNKHTQEQIDRLCQLITKTGFRQPVIISNLTGKLVSGHCRTLACKKMGISLIPVIYQDFENEAEEYAFLCSDNAISSTNWGGGLDLAQINATFLEFGPEFELDLLAIKGFTIDVPMVEMGTINTEVKKGDKKKVTCPNCGEVF